MRCARGADISFHAKLFPQYCIKVKNDKMNKPDFLYESDIYYYSMIHFQHAQEKKKRKKETYHNKNRLKFTFPVCILGCYPFM